VNDETVSREEDELGVAAQDVADEKQAGRGSPAAANRREGGVSEAAEAAWESCGCGYVCAVDVGIAFDQPAAVVDGRRAPKFVCARRTAELVAVVLSTHCDLFPGGDQVGILEDALT
jgi:hypothetical protein